MARATDRLKLFEDLGTVFTEDQARVLSKALYRVTEARRDELAIKLDLPNLETRRAAKPVALGGKIILVGNRCPILHSDCDTAHIPIGP